MKLFILPLILFLCSYTSGCQKTDNNYVPPLSNLKVDDEQLDNLLEEIIELSEKEACTASTEWTFSPIGHKPCGGPADYIAYSTKIGTEYFLEKIATYYDLHKKYNEDNGIISDCSMVNPPNSIVCENKKAVLVY